MSDNINDVLDAALGNKNPRSKMKGLPIEVVQSKPAYHAKALRTAGRLSRLMQARQSSDVTESITAHKEALSELGFRAPNTLKECNELIVKLEA